MRTIWALCFAVASLLLPSRAASAQEVATSFDALAARIQIGQRIWVTDVTGRETPGRLGRISTEVLVLKGAGIETFAAREVRLVRARDRDSPKNGLLIGLGIGAGVGTAWCIGAVADDSGEIDAGVECGEGFTVFPALGALVGLTVDALIPGKMRVVFRPSGSHAGPAARLRVVPMFSRHVKGAAVSFFF